MTSTLTSIGGTGLEPLLCAETRYRLPAVPERLPPATLMRERLRRWSLVHRAPSFAELREVRAGRLGEQKTQRWTRRHLTMTIGTVYGGKRVPRDASAAAMGRYEIDLLVITPRRVVALETKNWSGRLRLDGDQWVHERFGGEVRVYEDLIAYNRNKLVAVREYLRHCGVSLPPGRFHQALIFDNPRLKLDPRLAAHPAVISGPEVGVVVGQPIGSMRATLGRIIERCASAQNAQAVSEHLLDMMAPSQRDAACAAVAKLRTWDLVTLRGGRVLQGDLLWLRQGQGTIGASQFERDRVMSLRWRRGCSDLWSVLMPSGVRGRTYGALIGRQSSWWQPSTPIDVDDCLCFHEVGEVKPSVIALTSVERIQIG
jgi:Nuclease-related domain